MKPTTTQYNTYQPPETLEAVAADTPEKFVANHSEEALEEALEAAQSWHQPNPEDIDAKRLEGLGSEILRKVATSAPNSLEAQANPFDPEKITAGIQQVSKLMVWMRQQKLTPIEDSTTLKRSDVDLAA